MRILHVHWRSDSYGGGETYVNGISAAQGEASHAVAIIADAAFKTPGGRLPGRREYFVRASIGVRSGRHELPHVLRIVEDLGLDVVHFHQTRNLLSPLIVRAIQRRLPAVHTVHDVGLLCPNADDELIKVCRDKLCNFPMGIGCVQRGCYPILKKGIKGLAQSVWEIMVARGSEKVIVSSEYMRGELLRNGFPEGKIRILPLYTDMDKAVPAFPSRRNREKALLFVGRLDSVKGVIQFIQALSLIPKGEWKADIVGDGPLLRDAQGLVARLNLNGRTKFHGMVHPERMAKIYARAYLVCMPSMIPESFGLVGIEAMAFGNPVVAFDCGGIGEWLVDGGTGFLVERGDVQRLADKMSRLLEDECLAGYMGERGKERVERYYRKNVHLKRLLEIYEEAIISHAEQRKPR